MHSPGGVALLRLQSDGAVHPEDSTSCRFKIVLANATLQRMADRAMKGVASALFGSNSSVGRANSLVPIQQPHGASTELVSSAAATVQNACSTLVKISFWGGVAACILAVVVSAAVTWALGFLGVSAWSVATTVCYNVGQVWLWTAAGFTLCVQVTDGGCFPAHAQVMLAGQAAPISMNQLQIGHHIMSAPNPVHHGVTQPAFHDQVFMWGHRDAYAWSSFKSIAVRNVNATLDISPGHYLPVADQDTARSHIFVMTAAKNVRPGHVVLVWDKDAGSLRPEVVVNVTDAVYQGLFNPLTLDGTLIVNNVVTSAHSDWFLEKIVPKSMHKHNHDIYQAVLSPARMLYHAVGADTVKRIDDEVNLAQRFGQGGVFAYAGGLAYVVSQLTANGASP